jgi:hypothetical protein
MEVRLHAFLTSALYEGECPVLATAVAFLGEEPQYPLGGPPSYLNDIEKKEISSRQRESKLCSSVIQTLARHCS